MPKSKAGSAPTVQRFTHWLGVAMALSLFGDLALFASLPTHAATAGIAVGSLGLVFGIHRLIRIPGNTLGGRLIHRSNRRPFFLTGMVLALISTLGYALSTGLAWMLALRVVWGLAWILIYISSMTMMVDATTVENRGKWMGIYNTWYLVGIAGGSLSGGVIADWIGFRSAMLVCGGAALGGLAIALLGVPETRGMKSGPLPVNISVESDRDDPHISLFSLVKRTPAVAAVLLLYLVNQFAGEGVALSMLGLLLKEKLGDTFSLGSWVLGAASLSGMLLALRYVIAALLSPLIGEASDRIDRGRIRTIMMGLALSALSMVLIGYGRSVVGILAGMLVNALAGSILIVTLAAYLGDHTTPATQSRLIGLYATFGDTGSALGPMFGYWLLRFGNISIVFLVCAGLFILSLLFSGMKLMRRRAPAAGIQEV
ncbi:MAG: MFS transporter [Anaerolineae bacterium]|nr:MFS transporter [Anaerolineae bacterium]